MTTANIDSAQEHSDGLIDTVLLEKWKFGDPSVRQEVDSLIYRELRRLATTYMRRERRSHTLQATALVNEALTRVVGSRKRLGFVDDQHFYATAARIMRHVLVDHAKARLALKRGRKDTGQKLHDGGAPTIDGGIDLVELDESLEKLEKLDADAARAIELHYFAGLSLEKTAQIMSVSESTVSRHIRLGKAWLREQLTDAAR